MKKLSLLFVMFLTVVCVNAQTLSELVTEFKSEGRAKNIQALNDAKVKLQNSGVTSLDKFVENTDGVLKSIYATNDTIPAVYERVMGETMDGVSNLDVQKPSVDELEGLSSQIADNMKKMGDLTNEFDKVQEDVSAIRNPMQVKKAVSSVNYSKNALKTAKDELTLQGKMVTALLKQLKSDSGF